MLNRFRIGNNIIVKWSIFDAIGNEVDLTGRTLSIELHVGSKIIPITDYTISNNIVTFTFLGSSQIYTGTYSICLIENSGNPSMLTIDEFKIFVLVDHTWEGSDGLTTDFNVEFGSVLSGILGPGHGVPGTSAGFGTIDAEINDTSETPYARVETSGPDTRKNIHFVFSGIKGTPGSDGAAAGFGRATATVSTGTGTPSCAVYLSGPNTAKDIHFAFSNMPSGGGGGGGGGGASDPTGFLAALTKVDSETWKLSGNFAATHNISAGGIGSSGPTPGGAAYLYELGDVKHSGTTIQRSDGSGVQNGDAVVFDSTLSMWVASPVSSSGGAGTLTIKKNGIQAGVYNPAAATDTIIDLVDVASAESLNDVSYQVGILQETMVSFMGRFYEFFEFESTSDGYRIKAKCPLYSVGQISAGGIGSSGGGGGSVVVWNQIQQSGTRIATIKIDDEDPIDVYAPSGGGGASILPLYFGEKEYNGSETVAILSSDIESILGYVPANNSDVTLIDERVGALERGQTGALTKDLADTLYHPKNGSETLDFVADNISVIDTITVSGGVVPEKIDMSYLGTAELPWKHIFATRWYPNPGDTVHYIEYDAEALSFKVNGNIYATGQVAAGGSSALNGNANRIAVIDVPNESGETSISSDVADAIANGTYTYVAIGDAATDIYSIDGYSLVDGTPSVIYLKCGEMKMKLMNTTNLNYTLSSNW